MLDLEIRRRSSNAKSLDDAADPVRRFFEKGRNYTPRTFRRFESLAGGSLEEFFAHYVGRRVSLQPVLLVAGLRLEQMDVAGEVNPAPAERISGRRAR
jgi:predicted metalloprotease with PDZ domain